MEPKKEIKFPRYLKKSHFARKIGVSASAITNAIKEKKLSVTRDGLIDTRHPKNAAYAENARHRKAYDEKGQAEVREQKKREAKERIQAAASGGKAEDSHRNLADRDMLEEMMGALEASDAIEADLKREKVRQQTYKLKIDNEHKLRRLIDRGFVDAVIGRIGTVLASHMLTMGDRISADLVAACGVSGSEFKIKVKQIIDKDVSRSVNALKQEIQSRYEDKVDEDV